MKIHQFLKIPFVDRAILTNDFCRRRKTFSTHKHGKNRRSNIDENNVMLINVNILRLCKAQELIGEDPIFVGRRRRNVMKKERKKIKQNKKILVPKRLGAKLTGAEMATPLVNFRAHNSCVGINSS
uniref:Uncharacterized protein n=1 Tax=Romanomermis culicivorax TaxID=13658 RepID=A0A915J939_ROMCU